MSNLTKVVLTFEKENIIGQAKQKGSREERIEAAIERNKKAAEQKLKDDAEALEIAKQIIQFHFKYKDKGGSLNVAS